MRISLKGKGKEEKRKVVEESLGHLPTHLPTRVGKGKKAPDLQFYFYPQKLPVVTTNIYI